MFEPDAQRADRVLIRVSKGVDAAATLQNARRLVTLTRLLIATDRLRNYFSLGKFDHNAARIAHIHTEELLTERHDGHTS